MQKRKHKLNFTEEELNGKQDKLAEETVKTKQGKKPKKQMKVRKKLDFDYENRSLSVSDIVALNTNGNVSYYYVDSAGFKDIPGFDKNPLKAAELSVEDDADMIDGVINNGRKEPETERPEKKAVVAKSEKRPSVLKKLNEKKAEIAANPTETKEKSERSS